MLFHIIFLELKAMFWLCLHFGRGHWSSCDRDARRLDRCGLRQQAGLIGQSHSEVVRESRLHLATWYLPGQFYVLVVLSCRDQVIGAAWSFHPQLATALL